MLAGAFEDAAKAFSNANELKVTKAACLLRVQCFLRLSDFSSALKELQSVGDLGAPAYAFDIDVLTILADFLESPDPSAFAVNGVKELTRLMSKDSSQALTTQKALHWCKGVMLFYKKDYQKASTVRPRQEFQIALNDQKDEDQPELLYNICLCFALQRDYANAITLANELAMMIVGEERGVVLTLVGLMQAAEGHSDESRNSFEEASECNPELVEALDSLKSVHLKLMEDSQLSDVALDIPDVEVYIKPCFRLTAGDSPSMEIKHTKDWLNEFTVRPTQFSLIKCKFEAPWLMRNKGSIQFTEQVQETSIVLSDSDEAEEAAPTVNEKPRRVKSNPDVKSQMFSDDEVQVLNLDMPES